MSERAHSQEHRDIRGWAMGASLGAAVLMLIGKSAAFWITGSEAIFSDAVESLVHIAATGIAAFSLWFSHQEACEKHPYGHGKAAYFSAGFEGALICVAALLIFVAAGRALMVEQELASLQYGMAITAALALVNLVLGMFLLYAGRRTNAIILVANGRHVLTDMWTSLGVVAGVGLVWLTGLRWLDPLVAILVGLNIIWSGVSLMRRSFRGLLDEADPELTARLLSVLHRCVDEGHISGFHQLRHRQSNDGMWIELHVLLPGDWTAEHAHAHVTRMEQAIRDAFDEFSVYVTSHVEPLRHGAAHPEGHRAADPYEGAHAAAPEAGQHET
jgi:cation diffusion facilitator family transporter